MNKEHISLFSKQKNIAFITDAIHSSSLSLRNLIGIAKYVQKRRNFVLHNLPFVEISKDHIIDQFDGIIINLCEKNTHKFLGMLNGAKLPIVDLSAEVENLALIRVDIDLAREATMAAEWFLHRGFKNLAYCGFHGGETFPFSDIIEDAFAAVVKKSGCHYITFNMPPMTGKNKQYLRTLKQALDKWAKTLPPRTAVLCVHDRRALMLTQACLSSGRVVPDDIAIMGRNNDITTCVCSPVTITSVNSNLEGQGFAAMRILASAIEHPVTPKFRPTFCVPPLGIIERESTAVYPVDPPFLTKALLLLNENIDRPVSATALAKEVGVSSTTLRTAFTKVLGISLGKYSLSIRMREAKRLMIDEHYSFKEVAALTGFTSQAYFSSAYRAFYGHTPSTNRPHR